jgi:hypothetical protein
MLINKKTYFIRVGEFVEHQFSILEQLKDKVVRSPQLCYGGCFEE